MPNDPENQTKINWELVIAAAALCLAILAYLRPPDPAHPMRFDFLSHTVSLPLWVAIVAILGIGAITAAAMRLLRGNPAPDMISESSPVPPRPSVATVTPIASQRAASTPTAVQTPHTEGLTITPNPAGLRVDSSDDVSVQIGRHEAANLMGFTITFINERLSAISHVGVLIASAQSFNERKNDFRDGASFNPARLTYPDIIQASFSSRPMWLVRKEPSSQHLFAGDGGQSLIWPDNDLSSVQKWRMSISAYAKTVPIGKAQSAVQLKPIEFEILIIWHREENEFFVEKA